MGSLVMESFFGIPGLGSYTIDAINDQDFSIVRAMVFLGTALYILGLILTDIAYTVADPRVRAELGGSACRFSSLLPTDAVMWLITAVLIASFIYVRRSPRTREKWSRVFSRPIPQASCVILLVFFALGLADSIHFRPQLASASGRVHGVFRLHRVTSRQLRGELDRGARAELLLSPSRLRSLIKPRLSWTGNPFRIFAHLKGITPEAKTATDRNRDAALRTLAALSNWVLVSAAAAALILSRTPAVPGEKWPARLRRAIRGRGGFAAAASRLILAALLLLFLWGAYHPYRRRIKTGNDPLYQAVKSLRTAFGARGALHDHDAPFRRALRDRRGILPRLGG